MSRRYREADGRVLPTIFEPFVRHCESVIGAALLDRDFEPAVVRSFGRECTVTYRKKARLAVSVLYEPGATPGVLVTVARTRAKNFEVSLDKMIERRCPARRLGTIEPFQESSVRELLPYLVKIRDVLIERFPDVLEAPADIGDKLAGELAA